MSSLILVVGCLVFLLQNMYGYLFSVPDPFFLTPSPPAYSFPLERNSLDLPSAQQQPNAEEGEVVLL
jgi:hypothetical protein